MTELPRTLKEAVQELFNANVEPELTRPDEQFGDFSTNVAMQLAAKLAKAPLEIAKSIATKIQAAPAVARAEVAGAGFVNVWLTDEALTKLAFSATKFPKPNEGHEILVEFGDPNPFKEMHIGHLYSYIVGDGVSGLLESSGASVRRLSYHGDVGLHVAKAIFGLRELKAERGHENDQGLLLEAYAHGAKKYEEDESAKKAIEQINFKVYESSDPEINQLRQAGVELSFRYFDRILNMLSIHSDNRYLESETAPQGIDLVRKNIGSVFKESQGAVIFEGEKKGLHTRVFITAKGIPTYETKDLGLVELKKRDYPKAERSIVVTASEQGEYFKVMLAALAEIDKEQADKTTHLTHGFLTLSSGKMSSRTGDVYSASRLLDEVKAAISRLYPESENEDPVHIAAVKYAFLKHRLGMDIVFDVEESVSLQGNSGPYLQYAFARAKSILKKPQVISHQSEANDYRLATLDSSERSLARKLSEYPEVVQKATNELMPHHVCTYLYELAQNFNRFYETSRIIGDEREAIRLKLVESYSQVLKSGLELLNIPVLERI